MSLRVGLKKSIVDGMRNHMRLIFAGTPEVALPSLQRCLQSPNYDVAAVLTRPAAGKGRGRKTHPSPVAELAQQAGVPVLAPQRLDEPEVLQQIADLQPDCCPVVAYGNLIPSTLLSMPKFGWVNLHFSLLPAWRGAAPVPAAITAGDTITGATVFQLEEGLDTGPVLGHVTENIQPTDTAGSLLERLATSGAMLLETVLDQLTQHALTAQPQPQDGVSYAPKITNESARIHWQQPAFAIERHIRAMTPAPGAWTMIGNMRCKLGPVMLIETDHRVETENLSITELPQFTPGNMLIRKESILVGTGSVPVRLSTIQPPGKKYLPADAWARGARLPENIQAV